MGGTPETLLVMHKNVVIYHACKLFAFVAYLCLLGLDNRLNIAEDNHAITQTIGDERLEYYLHDHLTIAFAIFIDIMVIVFHIIRVKSIPNKPIDEVLCDETLYRTLEYLCTAGVMLYTVNRSRETFSTTEVETYAFLIIVNFGIQTMGFFEPFFMMAATGWGPTIVSNMIFQFLYISTTITGFVLSYVQIFVIHDEARYDMKNSHKTYINALLGVLWIGFGLLHMKHLVYALKWMDGRDKKGAEECMLSTAHNFAALGSTAKMLVFGVLGIPNSFETGRQILVIALALIYFVVLHMQCGAPLFVSASMVPTQGKYTGSNAQEHVPLMKLASSAKLRNRGTGKQEEVA